MDRIAKLRIKAIVSLILAAASTAAVLPEHPLVGLNVDTIFQAENEEILSFLPIVIRNIPEPIGNLQNEWYLMVDDGHILSRDVERIYHPFNKYPGNPVLKADRPWEGIVVQLYGTVLPGFRMWYSTYAHETHSVHVLYAESTDGLTWRKPRLNGTSRNVLFNGEKAALPSVIHAPNDLTSPFKVLVYQNGGFSGYDSFDGILNFPYPENPLYSNAGDVAQFYWDPITLRFRGTAKERTVIEDVSRRAVRFIDSYDLINWEVQPDLLVPDLKDDLIDEGFYTHFYGLPVFPIGEQYLGLLWVLKATDINGEFGQAHVQLVSSHDGTNWIREEGVRPPILEYGAPGEWDDGQIYTSNRPVKVGEELWLYYSGCSEEHSVNLPTTVCAIGLAKAGYNRLASLTGSGFVITEEFNPSGKTLHLNYDGSQGELRVQLTAQGIPIPGYEAENCLPMRENSQDQVVKWLAGSLLPEIPFQIEFQLENSSIFAFAHLDEQDGN